MFLINPGCTEIKGIVQTEEKTQFFLKGKKRELQITEHLRGLLRNIL